MWEIPPMRLHGMRVLPSLIQALDEYVAQPHDKETEKRLKSYKSHLSRLRRSTRVNPGTAIRREEDGRIHISAPCIQNTANALRGHFVPEEEGRVFVDADYCSSHLRIAATLLECGPLLTLLDKVHDPYQVLADAWGITKKQMKVVALAMLNGGDVKTLTSRIDIEEGKAKTIIEEWDIAFSELSEVVVRGRRGKKDSDEKKQFRHKLSALWLHTEARALDRVLMRFDEVEALGGRLILPMFDGLLADCPEEKADEVGALISEMMIEAMRLENIPNVVVKIDSRGQWGKEEP